MRDERTALATAQVTPGTARTIPGALRSGGLVMCPTFGRCAAGSDAIMPGTVPDAAARVVTTNYSQISPVAAITQIADASCATQMGRFLTWVVAPAGLHRVALAG